MFRPMKHFLDLLAHVPHLQVHGSNPPITHITLDSRSAGPGALFVARRGTTTDGHAFIADALSRGCSAVLCERPPDDPAVMHTATYALVADAHMALAESSHALFDFPARSLRMIGVTGTNGKTSCTTLLKQLLEAHGETVGMIGTVGNHIGKEMIPSTFTTPEAPELCALLARMKDAGCRTVVMEVSSHSLALHRVHGIDFAAALFTNLTQDHLDFHGTMDAYARAKKLLFDGLSARAVACVWSDDEYAELMLADCAAQAHAIGTHEVAWTAPSCASLTVHPVRESEAGLQGIRYTMDGTHLRAPLFGAFHVANTALAWQCMRALGYDAARTTDALRSVHGATGRMEVIELGGVSGIVDYAHTPDALEKTLTSIRNVLLPGQRLHCVVGCGGDRDRTKRPVMGAIACALSDVAWLTSDNPRTEDPESILREMTVDLPEGSAPRVIVDRRAAIRAAVQEALEGDVVLVAGKGHEDYQVIGTTKVRFSDAEELRAAVGMRDGESSD